MTASSLLKLAVCALACGGAAALAQDHAPQAPARGVVWTQLRVCPTDDGGVAVAIVTSSGSAQADEAAAQWLESDGADLLEKTEHADAGGCMVGRVASQMGEGPPAPRVWDDRPPLILSAGWRPPLDSGPCPA